MGATTITPFRQRADQPVAGRLDWLDVARGIGIIFVAVGHALGGLIDSPMGREAIVLRESFFVIYAFHMPLFFILSGALVARRVDRSRSDFGRGLILDLVWPYFLWSVVQYTIIFALGALANHPVGSLWPTFRALPYNPISQFWFLYALFLLHGFAIVGLRPLGRTGFFLACMALKPLGALLALPLVVRLATNQAFWYGLGVFLATEGIAALVVRRPAVVRLAILPVSAVFLLAIALLKAPTFVPAADLATAAAPAINGLAWNPEVFPAALTAALAVIGIAGFDLGRGGRILNYLGRRSMAIFILHIIAIAGARIVLTHGLHVTEPWIILPIAVFFGLIVPVAIFESAARFGWTRRLGLGRS